MATKTQAPPGKKRRHQYLTGEIFSLKELARLEFTSPDGGRKGIFEKKGPFCVTGMCMDRARKEDESYYVVLTDHDHPGWTTEIPMDMIVEKDVALRKPRCLGRIFSFLGGNSS